MVVRRALLIIVTLFMSGVAAAPADALTTWYFADATTRSSGPMAIVGDSLTISYWNGLPGSFRSQGFGPFQMEARSNRRTTAGSGSATSGLDAVRRIRGSGFDPPLWVVALGTNDLDATAAVPGATDALINAMLDEIGPGHRVLWVNVYSGSSLPNSRAFNERLSAVAAQRPMMTVADWYSLVAAHPGWLVTDGIHPNSTGAVQRNIFVAAQAALARGARQFGPQSTAGSPVGGVARFVPTDGIRLIDTIATGTPLSAGVERVIPVPAEIRGAATGAVVNLTATSRGGTGFVVAYACDRPPPATSSLNFGNSGSRSATTAVALDSGGRFCVRSSRSVDLAVDLQGALSPSSGSSFVPRAPSRLLDTREPPRSARLGVGQQIELILPSAGALAPTGGIINVTVINPVAGAAVSVGPCDRVSPAIASAPSGSIAANSAWVRADALGRFCVRSTAATDVAIDLHGVFVDGPGAALQLAVPARALDTRAGIGGWIGMPAPFQPLSIHPTGVPTDAVAYMYTVTSTQPLGTGFVVSWPCPNARPTVSILNHLPGSSVANSTVSAPDMCLATNRGAHLIADLVGWFVPFVAGGG
jgi:lysophospholipase L1-like esterase